MSANKYKLDRGIFASFLPMGILVLLGASPSYADPSPTIQFRRVAESGMAAPGTEPKVIFGALTTPLNFNLLVPKMDTTGRVAFTGLLTGPGVVLTTSQGMWAEQKGALQLVARGGQIAPGTGGLRFTGVPSLEIPFAPEGGGANIAFHAQVAGPGVNFTNDEGIWKGGPGNLTLVVREGSTPPDLPGVSFDAPSFLANNVGLVLLRSLLRGNGVNETNQIAFFSDRSGVLKLLLREGDPAPSTGPGTVFGGISPFQVFSFNDNSNIALSATLAGPGVSESNDQAIFVERNGALQLVLREGSAAPGAGPGATFGSNSAVLGVNDVEFNNNDRVAILVNLGGAVPTEIALFSDHTGALSAVAIPGRPAPGTHFNYSLLGRPVLNDANRIAFSAAFPDDGDIFTPPPFGVFSDVGGSTLAVVSPGDATLEGEIISDARVIGFNSAGQMLLSLEIESPTSRSGLWIRATNGSIQRIAATGDQFDVNGNGSDIRTVFRAVSGGMNEAGQIAIRLDFTDNSSAHFVASLPCQSISLDISSFVGALLSEKPDPVTTCSHDVNGDGTLNGLDVQPFIEALLGQ